MVDDDTVIFMPFDVMLYMRFAHEVGCKWKVIFGGFFVLNFAVKSIDSKNR